MIGHIYKTLQRAYLTDNLLGGGKNDWNQDLKITDVGTRWRESWSRTNEITVKENVSLMQYKLMYIIDYKLGDLSPEC